MKTTEAFELGREAGRASRLLLPFLPNPYHSPDDIIKNSDWHDGYTSERWIDEEEEVYANVT